MNFQNNSHMLRRTILLYVFINITLGIFSQNTDSLVNIKGYYITRFLKKEISFSYNQKIRRMKGESYNTPIDYTKTSFFIPSIINNDTINHGNMLNVIPFENNLQKDSIYYLPVSKREEKHINKISKLNTDLSKEICMLSEARDLYPYYIDDKNNTFLYKILFIEGCAMQHIIPNQERYRFPFYLDVSSVNKSSEFIALFFITNIKYYSGISNIEGLKEWFPYLDSK